jgi:cysteine desulfurase/selenocysteine lyase
VISFNIEESSDDIGTIIDKLGIAVRTGHHCAQPIMTYFNIPGTIRFLSFTTKKKLTL